MTITPEAYLRLQQFYFHEARLLDDRQFQQWLGLLTDDVVYRMPVRHVPQPDSALRGTEAFHDPAAEWGAADDPLYREENYLLLAVRAGRAFKPNAWAENPPARTRRFITNIEAWPGEGDGHWQVYSHFALAFNRHGNNACLYTGQRRDVLVEDGDAFRIRAREVRLDWTVITAPTLGLFF